ncbi:MAG: conserved membrane protein of unknown function [Candidatus Thorarchaeota archaeon]|nr:MAG: conserved membrane protein of unknown function [Candidatus Thorarchaeota archaeon]
MMPFTPYHFGPALLLGMVFLPFTSLFALLIGSVIIDLEPLIVLFFNLSLPLHGFFHSYLGATIAALLLSPTMIFLKKHLSFIFEIFRIKDSSSRLSIIVSCFIGTYSHVFLDSFLYIEMSPLIPLLGNPFVGLTNPLFVYGVCVICGLVGVFLFIIRLIFPTQEPEIQQGFD